MFAVLSAPVLMFGGLTLWAQSMASGWTPADGELTLPIRFGIMLNAWTIRMLPFVVIGLTIVWPLVVLAIAAVTGSFSPRNTATRRDVLFWWCVSATALIALLVSGGLLFQPDEELPAALAFLASVAWMAVTAFWVSLSAIYAVQQKRYAAGETAWQPRWLLAGLFALSCLGVFAAPILAVLAFRKAESRREAAG